MTVVHQVVYPQLLGSRLVVHADTPSPAEARALADAVHAEVARLTAVFDPTDAASELNRWRRGDIPDGLLSSDLAEVLAAAERWWVFSKGAFHPGAAPLLDRWRRAAAEDAPPAREELLALARSLELPYTTVDGPVRRTGDCSQVDLNSISRGYILDKALDAAWSLGLAPNVTLDATGDVRHRGEGSFLVVLRRGLVQDHAAEVVDTLELSNAALSMAPRAQRGFWVQGTWYRDVVDPLTGWPRDDIGEVAVLAPDCLTADVLGTVVAVGREIPPSAAVGSAWMVIRTDDAVERSTMWPAVGGTRSLLYPLLASDDVDA